MAANYHIRRLPTVHGAKSVESANGITLSVGDPGVRSRVITLASNYINQVSLPILKTNLGETLKRAPQNTKVVLFSSWRAYANALAEGGVDAKKIPSI